MDKPKFVCAAPIATTSEEPRAALTNSEFTQEYLFGSRVESESKVGSLLQDFPADGTLRALRWPSGRSKLSKKADEEKRQEVTDG